MKAEHDGCSHISKCNCVLDCYADFHDAGASYSFMLCSCETGCSRSTLRTVGCLAWLKEAYYHSDSIINKRAEPGPVPPPDTHFTKVFEASLSLGIMRFACPSNTWVSDTPSPTWCPSGPVGSLCIFSGSTVAGHTQPQLTSTITALTMDRARPQQTVCTCISAIASVMPCHMQLHIPESMLSLRLARENSVAGSCLYPLQIHGPE